MGYYSEVKIVAGRKAADEIRKIIAEHDNTGLEEIGTNAKGETLFVANWVKWYEVDAEFPGVEAIMTVVDKYVYELPRTHATELSVDQGMEYCRVGESDDDTDWRSNGAGGGYLSVGIKVHDEASFKPK